MPRILIVDDEKSIRSLLSTAFGRAGFEVRIATDGMEAMAFCSSESFDALLSDVLMPQVSGHDLIRWVGANHPAIRCVLMTAFYTDCEYCPFVARCKLLAKPFSPKDAVSLIERLLKEPQLLTSGVDSAIRERSATFTP
jgi:DNA-binding NtrC family response regulator